MMATGQSRRFCDSLLWHPLSTIPDILASGWDRSDHAVLLLNSKRQAQPRRLYAAVRRGELQRIKLEQENIILRHGPRSTPDPAAIPISGADRRTGSRDSR